MKQTTLSSLIDEQILQIGDEELILLESQQVSHPSSQKSYLAYRPKRIIKGYGNRIIRKESNSVSEFTGDPWQAIREFREEGRSWLFGYLGYDLKNHIENLTSENAELINVPDFYFMEPEVLLLFEDGKLTVLKGEHQHNNTNKQKLASGKLGDLKSAVNKREYLLKVDEIKNRIKEGDFYEMNYSYPITGEYRGDPYWLYSQMREVNPVPFGSYIKGADFSVCCTSPERFLKRTGSKVISEPIKGTSARSDKNDEDDYQKNLLLNEKNRAENLMIVDLVRHDLSRISKTGSVRVSKLFDIQSFGTVHQLISTIEAEITPGTDSTDVLKACFPMGSMTGAPKIEVMRAVEELEDYKRGIYSGAIGYFNPEGDFDFNVVIRSAMIQGEKLVYPVGGAITSDSSPEEEWEETRVKAKTLTKIFSS